MSERSLLLILALGVLNIVAHASPQVPCASLLSSNATAYGKINTVRFRLGELSRQSELVSEHSPLVVQFKVSSAFGSTINGLMRWAFDETTGSWSDGKFEVTSRNRSKASRVVHFFDTNQSVISDVRVVRSPESWRSYDLPPNAWVPKSTHGASPLLFSCDNENNIKELRSINGWIISPPQNSALPHF